MSNVRPFEEPSTVVQVSESVTERFGQVVDKEENEDKIVVPMLKKLKINPWSLNLTTEIYSYFVK